MIRLNSKLTSYILNESRGFQKLLKIRTFIEFKAKIDLPYVIGHMFHPAALCEHSNMCCFQKGTKSGLKDIQRWRTAACFGGLLTTVNCTFYPI